MTAASSARAASQAVRDKASAWPWRTDAVVAGGAGRGGCVAVGGLVGGRGDGRGLEVRLNDGGGTADCRNGGTCCPGPGGRTP